MKVKFAIIALWLLVSVPTAIVVGAHYWFTLYWPECQNASPFAISISAKLKSEPQEWVQVGDYLRHSSGLSFWTGEDNDLGFIAPARQDRKYAAWRTANGIDTLSQACLANAYREWRERSSGPQ